MSDVTPSARAVAPALVLTGLVALVYELIWTRWLGLILGNFATAVALVLMVFMGGLALGSWLFGRWSARLGPAASLRAFALLEAGIAACAASSALVLAPGAPLASMVARLEQVAVFGPALCAGLLLVPTVLMGGSLPVIMRMTGPVTPRAFATVYALNTGGAACGPLVAVFLLLPRFGFTRTIVGCAAVHAAVAVALLWQRPGAGEPARPEAPRDERAVAAPAGLMLAGASGFLALGFEVALTRKTVLMFTGHSVYGLALVLCAFLLGLALGGTLCRLHGARGESRTFVACAAALAVVWVCAMLTPFWSRVALALFGFWVGRPEFHALQLVNFSILMLLLLGFAVPFGFVLPSLVADAGEGKRRPPGTLLAANTAGAMAGAWCATFVLLPQFGLDRTLAVLGGLALAAAVAAGMIGRPARRGWIAAGACAGLALSIGRPLPDERLMAAGIYYRPAQIAHHDDDAPSDLAAAVLDRAGQTLFSRDSFSGHIAVRKERGGAMVFAVNGKPDSSDGLRDASTMILSAELALLHHPRPRTALVVGLGAGLSLGAMLGHPIESLTCLEIDPAVALVARWFWASNHDPLADHRVRLLFEDGRHFLARTSGAWDVMLVEPTNLLVSGMVNLYSREFYALAAARVAPGGVFCQWLQMYDLTLDDFRTVIRTARTSFPDLAMWTDGYGNAFLIDQSGPYHVNLRDWRVRLTAPRVMMDLHRIDLADPGDILQGFVMGPADLARFAGDGPLLTDDRPALEFSVPRSMNDFTRADINMAAVSGFICREAMPIGPATAADRLDLLERFLRRHLAGRAELEAREVLADPRASTAEKARGRRMWSARSPAAL